MSSLWHNLTHIHPTHIPAQPQVFLHDSRMAKKHEVCVCTYKNCINFYLTQTQTILSPLQPKIQTPDTNATLTQLTSPKQFQKQELCKQGSAKRIIKIKGNSLKKFAGVLVLVFSSSSLPLLFFKSFCHLFTPII